jgi:hypothetical protein
MAPSQIADFRLGIAGLIQHYAISSHFGRQGHRHFLFSSAHDAPTANAQNFTVTRFGIIIQNMKEKSSFHLCDYGPNRGA